MVAGALPPAARQKRPVADGTFLNFQLCYVSDGPHLFRLAGKDRGEKGRWYAIGASCVCVQVTNRFVRSHIAPTHLTVSDYAPPVISESNLAAAAIS